MEPVIAQAAAEYESATANFLAAFEKLSPGQLDVKHPDGWSARQVVHHLADSEAQSYARLRRLVAEPEGCVIQGYDEQLWADSPILGYEELPIENSLAVFKAVRDASLDIIRRLSAFDLERAGQHTDSGRYTISTWLANYSAHPNDHAEQLLRAAEGSL